MANSAAGSRWSHNTGASRTRMSTPSQMPQQAVPRLQGSIPADSILISRASRRTQNPQFTRPPSAYREPSSVGSRQPRNDAGGGSRTASQRSQSASGAGALRTGTLHSRLSGIGRTPPSERAPSQTAGRSRSASVSGSTQRPSHTESRTSRVPPSSYRGVPQQTEGRSRASSRGRSAAGTHVSLPQSRALTQSVSRVPSRDTSHSGSYVSLPRSRVSSRAPPSSINTNDLPSHTSTSRTSASRSYTGSRTSVSASGIPEGPPIVLCSCDEPFVSEDTALTFEGCLHTAKHLVEFIPNNPTMLQNKLDLIRHCMEHGVRPVHLGLMHWGICHIEGSNSSPQSTWTVRQQIDNMIQFSAEAEAAQAAQGNPNFGSLKQIAATMGCLDHQHYLGANPPAALESMKECHNRWTGHIYRPGCCGVGAYLTSNDTVSVIANPSRSGGSPVSVSSSGSRSASYAPSGRSQRSHASSRPPSSYRSNQASGYGSRTGSRASSDGGSRASNGTRPPSRNPDTITVVRPSDVWNGGSASTVVPGDSATQVAPRVSTGSTVGAWETRNGPTGGSKR